MYNIAIWYVSTQCDVMSTPMYYTHTNHHHESHSPITLLRNEKQTLLLIGHVVKVIFFSPNDSFLKSKSIPTRRRVLFAHVRRPNVVSVHVPSKTPATDGFFGLNILNSRHSTRYSWRTEHKIRRLIYKQNNKQPCGSSCACATSLVL